MINGSNIRLPNGQFSTLVTPVNKDGVTQFVTPVDFNGNIISGGGGSPGGSNTQVQFNDAGAFGGDSGLTYNKTTDTLTAGSVSSAIFTVPSGGSQVAPAFALGNLATGIYTRASFGRVNFTLSGSDAQVEIGSNLIALGHQTSLAWSEGILSGSNLGSCLFRDGSNVIGQRNLANGANAQAYRLYKSFTDASNFTRAAWQFNANGIALVGESAGTGDANISITLTPKGTGSVRTTGKIYPATDALAAQTAAGILAGAGAPNNANGDNGDFYLRSDGGALTTIYQKRTGSWVGIV